MKRKIIGIVIISLILFCGYVTFAQQINSIDRIHDRGKFTAEIGIGVDTNPDILLEGAYKMGNGISFVRGTYESFKSDRQGRFNGRFFGNNFFMELSSHEGIHFIYGRIKIIDNNPTFYGNWKGSGFESTGWITGEFISSAVFQG